MQETELHYIVPGSALLARLRRLKSLGPFFLQAAGRVHIIDHYLDTHDRALQRQGWACRLRQEDDRWLLTLKAPNNSQDISFSRTEREITITAPSQIPADWPVGELREKVVNLTGGAPLTKLVTIRQVRQRALVTEETRQVAELALDGVELRHTGVSQQIYILECELLPEGTQTDLDFMVTILVHHFCLLPDKRSKLQRALELIARGRSPDYDPYVRYQPRTLEELVQRYDIDPDYAAAVAATAERLFAELQPVHHLPNSHLPSLKAAAMLHDTGRSLGGANHQRLGYSQLLLQPLADLPDDVRVVAAASAYLHRGKISAKRLARAIPEPLQPADRERILCLAALVRLAVGLTPRSYTGAEIVKAELTARSVAIDLVGPGNDKLLMRLKQKSDLWFKIYGRKLDWHYHVREPVAHVPENRNADALAILPQDSIQVAAAKIIAGQLARMQASAGAVRLGQDPEAVHDLRVACRRMRSAFRLFGSRLVGSFVAPCRDGLRACAKQLGGVRNYEVQMDLALGYENSVAPDQSLIIEPLIDSWATEHQQARSSLEAYIGGAGFANLLSQLQELVLSQSRVPAAVKQRQMACEMAPQSLHSAVDRVMAYDKTLNQASLEELHLLRIECKRLRYSLEFLNDLLAGDSSLVLARLVDVQTQLGTLHDWYVNLAVLKRELEQSHSELEIHGIEAYRAYCYTHMNQAYLRSLASWRAYANPRIQYTLQCLLAIR